MNKYTFEDLHEDIYILEAVSLKRIVFSDGVLRSAAVEIDARLAYLVSAEQITYVSEKTAFLELYPDPKQVSVFRMLLAHGTLCEIRLLASDLQQELRAYWENFYFGQDGTKNLEADQLKYGRILMNCSNTAFEAMDMKLIPEPGKESKYWDRMVEVADALKGTNVAQHLFS
ncbi:hypothetical protein C6501_16285 [Candidatus Poribacteria bacterium]|nr:MAG: hypothetical protein C6501_16285 [Candidatus Poribacteria bacterium]